MKLTKTEEKVLQQWRAENERKWDKDIAAADRQAADDDRSQGDARDFRAQAIEMRVLREAGADYVLHNHKFGYERNRCICDQQWTHPRCQVCK